MELKIFLRALKPMTQNLHSKALFILRQGSIPEAVANGLSRVQGQPEWVPDQTGPLSRSTPQKTKQK